MVIQNITERGIESKYNNIVFSPTNNKTFAFATSMVVSATKNTVELADSGYEGMVIKIIHGRGLGQSRLVVSMSGNTATISPDWGIIPDTTSKYGIFHHSGKCQAQSSVRNIITLSGDASAVDNFYQNTHIKIVAGSGADQVTRIIGYDGATKEATVFPVLYKLLDDTSLYIIYGESGSAASATATTLTTDGNQSSIVSQYHYIEIYKGTGAGQIRMITGVSGDVITVGAWTTQPDTTSRYTIFGGWAPESYEGIIKYTIVTVALDIDFHDGERILLDIAMSMDNTGINSIHHTSELSLVKPTSSHAYTVITSFFRLKVVNMCDELEGAIQTIFGSYKSGKLTAKMEENISENNDCELSRTVITGRTATGTYRNVAVDTNGLLETTIKGPLDAFGSLATTQPEQFIELMFLNNFINPYLATTSIQGGSCAVANNLLTVSTTSSTTGRAVLYSRRRIRYTPGTGMVIRFTALFSEPVAESRQLIGIGDQNNGIFVGYNGTEFGILRRYGGRSEIRKLTITGMAPASGNVTVTLDGQAVNVAVLDTDTIEQIARKIASTAFAAYAWQTYEDGASIIFVSHTDGARSGTYSYVGSTGTFSTVATGVTATNDWTMQKNWNYDRAMGMQTLPVMDFQKGNVYQIDLQWLGFGNIGIQIEDPVTGGFTPLHRLRYTNSNLLMSLENPNLPLCVCAEKISGASTAVVTASTASMGAYTMGKINPIIGSRFGATRVYSTDAGALTAGTTYNILAIRNNPVFNGLINTSEKYILTITLSFNANNNITRGGTFKFIINPVIATGMTWTDRAPGVSSVSYCSDVVASSGGIELINYTCGASCQELQFVNGAEIYVPPGTAVSIVFVPLVNLSSASGVPDADISVSCSWIDR